MNTIKSIFNNFREHIVELCSNRRLFEPYLICNNELQRKTLFSRTRIWTLQNTVNAIMLCFKQSLSTEITEFFLARHLQPSTPEAYIKRRSHISSTLFKDLNIYLMKSALNSGILKLWKGKKYLCGIDGTRLSLPYTPTLFRQYRERSGSGHNLARGAFITDLLNRVIVSADIYPNKTEERKSALDLLTSSEFPYPLQSTVFVMDRGYPSLYLMNWFHKNTAGFIIRARRDTNPAIAKFMKSDKTAETVVLKLSENRRDLPYRRPQPLTVRLIKRPPMPDDNKDSATTEPVVFITDLDESEYPDEVIVQAYKMRWHSETEIGTEKNELQIEIFSGIRDVCIRQDFYSAIILYNLESLLRIPCNEKLAHHKGKYDVQVDMNCTWKYVIDLIYAMVGPPKAFIKQLTFTVKMFLRFLSVQRPGRSEPRNKRYIKLSGKYITFTNYKRAL